MEIPSGALLDAGHFLATMAHEFICAAEARHDAPNIARCRGYVESKGDLRTAIARWKEASNSAIYVKGGRNVDKGDGIGQDGNC